MEKETFWMLVIAAIVILVAILIWQTSALSAMHPGAPAQAVRTAVSSSGMVGGC